MIAKTCSSVLFLMLMNIYIYNGNNKKENKLTEFLATILVNGTLNIT